MATLIIPLFPLEVVLFPGVWLPLHIFEPRYREMIGWCLEQAAPFGIILEQGQKLERVGCTAGILGVIKKYPDGRMDISTQGEQRFQVENVLSDRAYDRASVIFFDDDAGPQPSPSLVAEATALYEKIADEIPRGKPPAFDRSPARVSFGIAAALHLDLALKQKLLEMRAEVARLELLISEMSQWLPRIERARKAGGGNGHFH